MAGMRKSVARVMRMRLARGFAEQPIGQSAIVEKPVAEIGVLRPGPGCNRKYVGVKAQGGSQSLAESGAEQAIPRARSGLELGLEDFPEWVDQVGRAGRGLDTEQHRRLRSAHLIVQEAILAKHGYIAEARCGAAVTHRGGIGRIFLHAFENAGAAYPWQAHRHRQVVGDAISKRKRPTFDRLQAMDVVTDIGEQSWIAQLLQPEIVDERGKSELALIEGAGADRENATGAADAADARMMRRCGARADGRRCDQSRSE